MCLYVNESVKPHFLAPESHVRTHAYHLWENAGKPDNCFWSQAEKECHYIIAYKVVLNLNNSLVSPIQDMTWKKGWNQSDRPQDDYAYNVGTDVVIFRGIHVLLDPWEAHQIAEKIPDAQVITVHCFEEDFIAAGTCSINWQTKTGKDISILFNPKFAVFPKSAVFYKVFAPDHALLED